MKLLVTGASGLVGGRLAALLSPRYSVLAARHRSPTPPDVPAVDLDLLSCEDLEKVIETLRPDAVLHCAALTDPDLCERNPELAERLNVEASAHLARVCHARGVRLIALSTDLVFSGERAFVTESEPPEPLMVYGRTKLRGEDAILVESPDATVLRIPLVYGCGHGPRPTASEAIAWALKEGRTLRLYVDQYRSPIDPESVADAVTRLLDGQGSGRYHLGGPERISRYAFGIRVARALGLPAGDLRPTTQDSARPLAPRPADVSFALGRAVAELGWWPRPLDVAIRESRPQPDIMPQA
jgi:dTDP-4-dehydrorhamnose reductase